MLTILVLGARRSLLDLIVDTKPPYYAALEAADAAWADNNRIDLGALEGLLEKLLGAHLVSVLEEAKGQPIIA
jgi:hypothetical protein